MSTGHLYFHVQNYKKIATYSFCFTVSTILTMFTPCDMGFTTVEIATCYITTIMITYQLHLLL